MQEYRNPDRDTLKRVTLFAARLDAMPAPTPQAGEIATVQWVPLAEAPAVLTYTLDRDALRDVLTALDMSDAPASI